MTYIATRRATAMPPRTATLTIVRTSPAGLSCRLVADGRLVLTTRALDCKLARDEARRRIVTSAQRNSYHIRESARRQRALAPDTKRPGWEFCAPSRAYQKGPTRRSSASALRAAHCWPIRTPCAGPYCSAMRTWSDRRADRRSNQRAGRARAPLAGHNLGRLRPLGAAAPRGLVICL